MIYHKPVLVEEVMECLDIQPNDNVIDATVGEGGHTIEMLKKNGPEGKVLCIDADKDQIEKTRINTKEAEGRIVLAEDSYVNIKSIIERTAFQPVNGILADLGYSSWHLESRRGFSFQKNEVLDMRYSQQGTPTAKKVVNEYREEDLERIFREYGEEKFARHIAKAIVNQRQRKPIETTFDLAGIIEKAVPAKGGKIHYATRVFQAVRIEVNQELENLKTFLPSALSVLSSGGRLVVISFHSLEDRIIKHFFQEEAKKGIIHIITKKPLVASWSGRSENPRARSAKVRAIKKA